jgi:2-oxoglutarate dehydrogenase complex dehydrogenase (E1) component-like enzyme
LRRSEFPEDAFLEIQGPKSAICKPYPGRKENLMEFQDFCETSHIELASWKAKIYDVMRKMEKLPPAEKAKTQQLVNDLHVVVEEIANTLTQLQKECPAEWSNERKKLQQKFKALGDKWEQAWKYGLGPGIGP